MDIDSVGFREVRKRKRKFAMNEIWKEKVALKEGRDIDIDIVGSFYFVSVLTKRRAAADMEFGSQ